MTHIELAPGATLPLRYLNRHALVTGATGTGKTVTLAAMVEGLAAAGVPVLAIDAKGDLESLGRVLCPYGQRGHRAPLDLFRMGPEIVARALDLSEAQSGALYVLQAFAEAEGWPLATVDDLLDLCSRASANARVVSERYGLITPASLAAVRRALLRLDKRAFGRPGFDLGRLKGVTVYAAAKLARKPEQYAAAVAWMLLDLYERSPERGDRDRPALAVVIDEAHLIFDGIPAALERRLAQVARLIRSKGVALIWASQSPGDLPQTIAGQCLTRIQHGLRASTPAQLRDVRAAADSLPQPLEGFDAASAILSLGVGEALVSLPDAQGTPQPCQRVSITPGRIKPGPGPEMFRLQTMIGDPAGVQSQGWPSPSRPISPPGSRAIGATASHFPARLPVKPAWTWWRGPLRFLLWTVALVGIIAFIG